MLAYVHNLSPVKKSKRQVSYFNCQLQSQNQSFEAVAFKAELHESMKESTENKSPIKISGFKRRANFRDNQQQDIELNKMTKITMLSEAPFKYKSMKVDSPEVMKVRFWTMGKII